MKEARTVSEIQKAEQAVLVFTEYRGVFFGYTNDPNGDVILLRNARNCIYWDASIGGVMGLAEKGPSKNCRVGARSNLKLRKITAVAEVTETAVAAWENQPCYVG